MSITETPMPPYPWQAPIWQNFYESVVNQRVPHAILLSGVDGIGVNELAYSMVRYLLCGSPLEDLACGRCRACQLFAANSHPDLFVLKREDGADQIKVDQVRACVEFVVKTAFADGPKVVLVEDADSMNTNAANALLKSLEEPQGQTVFILATHRVSAILPTIRSRCRAISLATPASGVAEEWLREQGLELDEALFQQSGGAPVLYKRWLEGDFAALQRKVNDDLLALLSSGAGAIQAASAWQNLDLEQNLQMHLHVLESAIKSKLDNEVAEPASSTLQGLLCKIDSLYLFRLRDKLLLKLAQVRGQANLNTTMLNEELAMDWFAMGQLIGR